ncbi:DUF4190 domain-containing protein [uncultured Microbacterium sp.]|uniref:DUF4190 domain-containing protein n=1 Tax=uncultured Microbacterium sp. TaxID=191216 RepID=UPI0035C9C678
MTNPSGPEVPQPPAYQPPPAEPAPPAYASPLAPAYAPPIAPAYAAPGPAAPIPGRTLGIVAIFVAIFFNFIGLILGIVALVQSRKAGAKNGPAVAAIIIGAVLLVLGIVIAIAVIVPLVTFASDTVQACAAVDFTGTVVVRGVEVTCTSSMR